MQSTSIVRQLLEYKFRGVSRTEYDDWERKAAEYLKLHGRDATKRKWIVAAYLEEDLAKFNRNELGSITKQQKWKLFHAGSETPEMVSYGFDAQNGTFKLAATDTGGLTNAHLRTPADLDDTNSVKTAGGETALELYQRWLLLSRKPRFCCGKAFESFETWLKQVRRNHGARILFYKVNDERKKLAKAEDVKSAIGAYYVRTHNKDDQSYARVMEDVKGLYASLDLEKGFLVANINRKNIQNEYTWTGGAGGREAPIAVVATRVASLVRLFVWRLRRLWLRTRKSRESKSLPAFSRRAAW